MAYSLHFGRPPCGLHPAYVITSHRGLLPLGKLISLTELREFGTVPIDLGEPRYREPLRAVAAGFAAKFPSCEWVLLGSISTSKYTEPLLETFGPQLHFPADFVGRGDMSRGGLLLRSVADRRELEYLPVGGAIRRGKRPGRLAPRWWGYRIDQGETLVPRGNDASGSADSGASQH